MQKLQAGIHNFQATYFARNRRLFEKLAEGQRPETLFITCADSRVDPNLITSSAPGEMFTVRNVGNIVPSYAKGVLGGVSAALEFAVEVLKVGEIIVCGHTQCGAIDAILQPNKVSHLPLLSRWIEQSSSLPGIIDERYSHLEGPNRATAAVEENVLLQIENLRTFPFVRERMDAGEISVSGWVFRIATGDVFDYNPESGQFEPLGSRSAEPLRSAAPAPAL